MKLVFSSKEYPNAKRFEAYRNAVCDHYVRVDMPRSGSSDYIGSIKEAKFGVVTLTDNQAPTLHITRRRSHLSTVDKDCVYVAFAMHGAQEIVQGGRSILYDVGKAGLFSATEPYALITNLPARYLFVEIPRQELLRRIDGCAPPVTAVISTTCGIGRVAASFCSALAMESRNLGDDIRQRLGNEMLGVLALAFSTREQDASEAFLDSDVRSLRIRQVKAYIEANLHNPLLSPERIANANQMSVRSLQYLFKSADLTVSEYVWSRRLERCRKELELTVGRQRTVTESAMEAGFNSLSHFSSVFRKRFGVSPTDMRGNQGWN